MKTEVIQGDSLDVLRTLEEETFDAVITDPPYGIAYKSKSARLDESVQTVRNDERPFIWWLYDAHRVLKSPGALVCFCRWDVQEVFRVAIDAAGFDIRGQMVWDRGVHGQGDAFKTPAPRHDVMWFATKGRYSFPGGRPKSVIQCMRVHGSKLVHPTEKPVGLMRTLIKSIVPRGGMVLDPFCGSGSTGEAARTEGMGFLGIEIEPKHVATARRRIEGCAPLFLPQEQQEL